jgi:hypothetical protein
VLRAIGELGPHWDDAQRAALRKALQHVIDTHADQRIKVDAQTAFTSLQ